MKSPSLQKFEIALERHFSQHADFASKAKLVPMHPKTSGELGGKSVVVVDFVNDLMWGKYITYILAEPYYSFTIYATTFPKSRGLQELVTEILEDWQPPQIDEHMVAQRVQLITRYNRNGPSFEASVGLFYSTISASFRLVKT